MTDTQTTYIEGQESLGDWDVLADEPEPASSSIADLSGKEQVAAAFDDGCQSVADVLAWLDARGADLTESTVKSYVTAERKARGIGRRRKGKAKPRTSSSARSSSSSTRDRTASVAELIQSVAGVPMGIGFATQNVALLADGAVIMDRSDEIAQVLAAMAERSDALANVLDKASTASPFVGVGLLVGGIVAQIAANHKVIGPGLLSSVDAETYVASSPSVAQFMPHLVGSEPTTNGQAA